MSAAEDTVCPDAVLVARQTGRAPRAPWRVASRCRFGRPTVIASPSRLDDGTPFPTMLWLTCPHLAEKVGALESGGALAEWAARVAADERLASAIRAADEALRTARRAESGGEDACESVGVAGQRDALGIKCLHARVALVLAGIDDPVGTAVLAEGERECDDDRCARLCAGEE